DSDQRELQQSARRFVTDHPEGEWSRLAELGWLGLAIPERHGGAGASRSDMAVIFEELGRAAVPGPIFASAVLAVDVISTLVPEAITATFTSAPARTQSIDASAARAAILRATPILCAYQVGSCQAVFEMSVAYSGERMQFGKPIGTFQRVQDHIIDLVNVTESARWATNHAVWRTDAADASAHDIATAVHVSKPVTAPSHIDACPSPHAVHRG